jgi:hypothetical protein
VLQITPAGKAKCQGPAAGELWHFVRGGRTSLGDGLHRQRVQVQSVLVTAPTGSQIFRAIKQRKRPPKIVWQLFGNASGVGGGWEGFKRVVQCAHGNNSFEVERGIREELSYLHNDFCLPTSQEMLFAG